MPIYMKYPGVTGTVTEANHKGWIDIQTAQLGINRHGVNREATVPPVSEIIVTKSTDQASADLFRESMTGSGVKVTIDFVNADNEPYLSIELEGALISSYQISGHGSKDNHEPFESIALNFTKVTYAAKAVKPPSGEKHSMLDNEWRTAIAGMA